MSISKLYKYCALSDEYTLSNLKNDIVHYSIPKFFNDPFDCFCGYNPNTYMEEVLIGILLQEYADMDDELQECLYKIILNKPLDERESVLFSNFMKLKDNCGVDKESFFSNDSETRIRNLYKLLTKNNDDQKFLEVCKKTVFQERMYTAINQTFVITCFCEIHDNPLMWSHYADRHRGICIEYDLNMLPNNHSLLKTLYPVNYSKKRPCLPTGITLDAHSELVINIPTLTREQIVKTLITKSTVWASEKEWRSIDCASNLDNNNLVLPIISKVYLGANISSSDKEEIEKICLIKKIPVVQMKLSCCNYELVT